MALRTYANILNKKSPTPQSAPIPGREADMSKNSAGAYSFAVDEWEQYRRFLILGSEGGSYYASDREMTLDNAKVVERVIQADAARAIELLCSVSEAGRAPRNTPAIFALAVAAASTDVATRKLAYAAIPRVCRTGTHLFHFAAIVDGMRGWSRGLRNAVARWYGSRTVEALAYQIAKYPQRDGWGHADLLRLSHPESDDLARQAAFRWTMGLPLTERTVARKAKSEEPRVYPDVSAHLPALLTAVDEARTAQPKRLRALIREHGLTREMIPTEALNDAPTWEALLERMPLTAMIRSLGKMSSLGLLASMSTATKAVTQRLGDRAYLRKSRVHPLSLLVALKVYSQGKGEKGSLTWKPQQSIIDALDAAFYAAYDNVPRTNKNWLLALDVSGSMGGANIAGLSNMSARDASAAMALVTANTEPGHHFVGFTSGGWTDGRKGQWASYGYGNGLTELAISPRRRLDDVIKHVSELPMGGTDCALPMLYAIDKKLAVDVFVVYTDSETWAGDIQPVQALQRYRDQSGLPAKLIVVGMVSNGFTIADPKDAGMLDVVGFDTTVPALMAEFAGVVNDPRKSEDSPEDE